MTYLYPEYTLFLRPLPIIKDDCLIQIVSDMNLVDYLLTQRKVERYYKAFVSRKRVASFLNFVPVDLEATITVEESCLPNFISVAKLHLFHKLKSTTILYSDNNRIELKWTNEGNHLNLYILFPTIYIFGGTKEKKKNRLDSWLTRG